MLDFNNTQIAFQHKSDKDLKRSYWLFRLLAQPWLVKIANFKFRLAIKIHFPVAWIVKPTVYRQFVGGTSLEECKTVVKTLEECNVKAILDYSIEKGESAKQIEATLQETLQTIYNAASNPNIPFAVFKPTAFGDTAVMEKLSKGVALSRAEQQLADGFKERVEILCRTASDTGVPLLIDAEDSWYQKYIDDVVTEMMQKYNKTWPLIFNTFQMYRHDRLEFLKGTIRKAGEGNYYAGLKFVRGAYMEKERARAKRLGYESPIYPDKESTDKAYNEALRISMEHIDRVAIFNGTHNEESNMLLTKLIEQKGLPRDDRRFFFSQLYGMSDHISFNLASEKYNVAKYVPYGPVRSVMPYLLRRAEENTSIAGQTGRELRLLVIEKKRR
jgi:proline dehydrogenase